MLDTLLFLLVPAPFLLGAAAFLARPAPLRGLIVGLTSVLLVVSALALTGQAPFSAAPEAMLGIPVGGLVVLADFLLLALMFSFAYRHKRPLIMLLTAFQAVLLAFVELFMVSHAAPYATFTADTLSLTMVLVICIVGSVICLHALPYMKQHEAHQREHGAGGPSKQGRFFAILLLFLGAMNGLVLTNDLLMFYFFFEATTLCSFLLIGHDGDETSTKNALHALLLNALGGAVLLVGITWLQSVTGSMELSAAVNADWAQLGQNNPMVYLPLALICIAAFTKAAQLPFQSWLLGAMVAPTPTSALLHSSTMVKAGVYLILRFSPALENTFLGTGVALFGAFTFIAAAALAIGQSNGKKVLAYSTVSNLGLMIACGAIGTPAAITAGMLLLVFHAVSKALMFLCVGTIEQRIGSRDIEDMRGLYGLMPLTSLLAVIGVFTMILPPFGMLLGKWMAIESASGNFFLTMLLAFGSALTVLYWARWAGAFMSSPTQEGFFLEKQPFLTRMPLVLLCAGAVLLSMGSPLLYAGLVSPMLESLPFELRFGSFVGTSGLFAVYPLFIIIAATLILAVKNMKKPVNRAMATPYLGGVQMDDPAFYKGPMGKPVAYTASNYYLPGYFGESTLTVWANNLAGLLLLLLLGGALA